MSTIKLTVGLTINTLRKAFTDEFEYLYIKINKGKAQTQKQNLSKLKGFKIGEELSFEGSRTIEDFEKDATEKLGILTEVFYYKISDKKDVIIQANIKYKNKTLDEFKEVALSDNAESVVDYMNKLATEGTNENVAEKSNDENDTTKLIIYSEYEYDEAESILGFNEDVSELIALFNDVFGVDNVKLVSKADQNILIPFDKNNVEIFREKDGSYYCYSPDAPFVFKLSRKVDLDDIKGFAFSAIINLLEKNYAGRDWHIIAQDKENKAVELIAEFNDADGSNGYVFDENSKSKFIKFLNKNNIVSKKDENLNEKWWNSLTNEWKEIFLSLTIINQEKDSLSEIFYKLKFLRTLTLSATPQDISPLSKLTNLKTLELYETAIDLSSISNLTKLKKLTLNDNTANLSPISNLTNLEILELHGNDQSLTPISGLTTLLELSLAYNMADLSPISNLTNLKDLNVNGFQDLSPIEELIETIKANGGSCIP